MLELPEHGPAGLPQLDWTLSQAFDADSSEYSSRTINPSGLLRKQPRALYSPFTKSNYNYKPDKAPLINCNDTCSMIRWWTTCWNKINERQVNSRIHGAKTQLQLQLDELITHVTIGSLTRPPKLHNLTIGGEVYRISSPKTMVTMLVQTNKVKQMDYGGTLTWQLSWPWLRNQAEANTVASNSEQVRYR